MFERFTEPGIKVVVTAQEEARKIGNNFVGTEQVLLGLIAETSGIGGRILRKYGVTLKLARDEIKRLVGRGSGFVAVEIPFTPRARRVLENAIEESKTLGFPYVGPEHILLGILMEDSGIAITALRKILKDVNPDITFDIIRQRTLHEMGEEFEEEFGRNPSQNKNKSKTGLGNKSKNEKRESSTGFESQETKDKNRAARLRAIHPYFDPSSPLLLSPILNEYTQNVTQMAFAGRIDPVIGRTKEVERVLQILSRRRKNNPILLGEPGVGKTAVAEGLALEIIGGNVPMVLQGKNVITLDLGLIIAGSRYRGDFEKRLKRVISDVQMTNVYVLVIDEVHTLVGAGAAEGSLDAANILKPALARGEFQCIGATTMSEYRKYIEPDAALARRFHPVVVAEPSVDDTITILTGIRDKYELHHQVVISQNAIEDAALLSSKYINDRFLPDKAIDIIDEACSRVRVAYEMIPDICQLFEDQLSVLQREKVLAYTDKDWLTALTIIREEVRTTKIFLEFLYKLVSKFKEEKKIWIIRSLQQRYQFVFKGIQPLVIEWTIVADIHETIEKIYALEREPGWIIGDNDDWVRRQKVNQKIKETTDEAERLVKEDLLDHLTEVNPKTNIKDYISKPAIKDERLNFDSDDSDVELYTDEEIEVLEDEIKNMEEVDILDELEERFNEGPDIEIIPPNGGRTNEKIRSKLEQFEASRNVDTDSDVENSVSNKIEAYSKSENVDKTSVHFIENLSSSVSTIELVDLLSEFGLPLSTDKEKAIPEKIIKAIQRRLFFKAFKPFVHKMDKENALDNYIMTQEKVFASQGQFICRYIIIPQVERARFPDFNNPSDVKNWWNGFSIANKIKNIPEYLERDPNNRSSVPIIEKKRKKARNLPHLENLETFLKYRKLWSLFRFITWNSNKVIFETEKREQIEKVSSTKNKSIKTEKEIRKAVKNNALVVYDNINEKTSTDSVKTGKTTTKKTSKKSTKNKKTSTSTSDNSNTEAPEIMEDYKPLLQKTYHTLKLHESELINHFENYLRSLNNFEDLISLDTKNPLKLTSLVRIPDIDVENGIVPLFTKNNSQDGKRLIGQLVDCGDGKTMMVPHFILEVKVVRQRSNKNQVGLEFFNLYQKINVNKEPYLLNLSDVEFDEIFEEKNATLAEEMTSKLVDRILRIGLRIKKTTVPLLPDDNQLSKSQQNINVLSDENNLGNNSLPNSYPEEVVPQKRTFFQKMTLNRKVKPTKELSDLLKENPGISEAWNPSNFDKKVKNKIQDDDDDDDKDFLPDEKPFLRSKLTNNLKEKSATTNEDERQKVLDETKQKVDELTENVNELDGNLDEINRLTRYKLNIAENGYIPWVFASDVSGIVSDWTGIPLAKVSKSETQKLLNIEKELQRRVIGQPDAVSAIAKALRRGRLGLRDAKRPIASLFFSGPTGVGKTEVTKALAASYFGGESDMVRFDMSEFMERHTVSKLIGSPPGYVGYTEGGLLTEAVRRKPYVVVLFDEVEKAHPEVFNLLLQVLEDGRLSDSQGRVIDFKNTIIVMTSNLGAKAIQNPEKFSSNKEVTTEQTNSDSEINNQNDSDSTINNEDDFDLFTNTDNENDELEKDDSERVEENRIKELVHEELKGFFKPEFLNRIDEIVVFQKLNRSDIREIAAIMLLNLKERLLSKSYNLIINETAINQIIDEGFNPDYGARPLRRVITNRLEDNLAATILEQRIEPGSTILIEYINSEFVITHNNYNETKDYLSSSI